MSDVVDGRPEPVHGESATVQAFIREQQRQVLTSARESIAGCPADELGREAHRLRGTLGTYQLTDAVEAMTSLELAVDDASDGTLEAARAEALAALDQIQPDQADERGYAS